MMTLSAANEPGHPVPQFLKIAPNWALSEIIAFFGPIWAVPMMRSRWKWAQISRVHPGAIATADPT
jgi:hypothetical protein